MRRYLTLAALLTALGLLFAACGGGGDGTNGDSPATDGAIVPVSGNSELVLGANRFALGLLADSNQPILGEPGVSVRFRFFYEDESKGEQDASFVWAIPDITGFFVANVDFDQAGNWQVEAVVTQDGDETIVDRLSFSVRAESQVPNIGDAAPPSTNLTLSQEPNVKRLSTDQDPEPTFYQMTVADALAAGQPLLVVFATPAFCETRFCGPVVDNVKEVSPEFEDRLVFIHIEPFELDADGQLVTGEDGFPVPVGAVVEWNLPTEPWVFIIDAQGRITARFEGAAGPEELREAIKGVLAG